MKKILKALKFSGLLLFVATLIIACDKDYNSIGTDIIGGKNFITDSADFPIIGYTKKVKPVQTNGLSSNLLGAYYNPEYGLTTASIVSQIVPEAYSPAFGDDPVIESVILTIPYFSTVLETDEDGAKTYQLDSLFGSTPFKLSIYQNTYYLRDTDPSSNFTSSQTYYSNANQTINFDNFKGELLYVNESFYPDASEIVIEEESDDEDSDETEVTERLSPRINVELLNTNDFWKKLIFDKEDSPELSNQNNWVNYFRGLYLKAEPLNGKGNQFLINLASDDAKITINYTYQSSTENDDGTYDRYDDTYVLKFNTTRLNIFESDIDFKDGNPATGDENLYLKGGEGSMAIIDLFHGPDQDGDGQPDNMLEDFMTHKDKWLINEAQLTIYEDASKINTNEDFHAFDRIAVYDIKNQTTVVDYSWDPTDNTSDPLLSKIAHLGVRQESQGTYKYKIRLTEHIKNILLKDSTNTKLGLVISTNVNRTSQARLLNSDGDEVTTLPEGSVLSPRGTILHGTNSQVPENLRAKLEIYYTEPEN